MAERLGQLAARRGWLRLPPGAEADIGVKPVAYLPVYERILAPYRYRPIKLLELGVYHGDSLRMWRDAFPLATVIGVDLVRPTAADGLGPRTHFFEGNQTDGALMRRIRDQLAPAGFDVVIDDASHLARETAASLVCLYGEHLRPDGIYCVEDWGAGYIHNWPDGRAPSGPIDLSAATAGSAEGVAGADFVGHTAGMVGLMKSLVDHVACGTTLRGLAPSVTHGALPIASMTVYDGIVVLRKPRPGRRRS
jgi:SAM-dependent methyltransferase